MRSDYTSILYRKSSCHGSIKPGNIILEEAMLAGRVARMGQGEEDIRVVERVTE
jgi:hypothetical protein